MPTVASVLTTIQVMAWNGLEVDLESAEPS